MIKKVRVLLGKIFPPKETPFERGYVWAKGMFESGIYTEAEVEACLNGSDAFDKGAAAFLRERHE
jgi:hypothetical protein